VGAGRTCDFRSGKIILQQEVGRGDMQKLLATGRTDLLKGFISNKTRRKFSAFLVRDPKTGKVGFEFEPSAPKAGRAAAKPAAKADAANEAALKKAAAKKPVAKKTATRKFRRCAATRRSRRGEESLPRKSPRQRRREEAGGEESLMAGAARPARSSISGSCRPARRYRPEWFRKDDAFDAAIRERFGAAVDAALAGTAPAAAGDGEMLARILLLDQFTRNIFRGTPRAFAGDAQALALARNWSSIRPRQEPRPLAALVRLPALRTQPNRCWNRNARWRCSPRWPAKRSCRPSTAPSTTPCGTAR
jgi:hypothetical protein